MSRARSGDPRDPNTVENRTKTGVSTPFLKIRPADAFPGTVGHEDAVRRRAPRVHDPLQDALVIEVADLLAQVVILQQRRSAGTRLQRVIAVAQPRTVRGGQELALLGNPLRRRAGLGTGRGTRLQALLRLRRQRNGRDRRLFQGRGLAARCSRDERAGRVGRATSWQRNLQVTRAAARHTHLPDCRLNNRSPVAYRRS